MSALDLLREYSSDSENEDTCKDERFETRVERLPLPESISTWKGAADEEIFNDPSKHEGRIRTFEHERGNWATLIYIKYVPSNNVLYWMKCIKSQIKIDSIILQEEFHISLTRTLVLKYHWIDSFVESVKQMCSNIRKFTIKLKDLELYCNDTETRTFLGLRCYTKGGLLENITKQFNHLLAEFSLPPFYEDASFHISFMWCLGNKRNQLEKILPHITANLEKLLEENVEDGNLFVNAIHCKIGNRKYIFNLND